jgi:uncharacterized protein YdeI (BOF family)
MGGGVSGPTQLVLTANAIDLDAATEPITLTLYDRTLPLVSSAFTASPVEWSPSIPGQPGHFYWLRAEQADGDVAQTAPIWVEGVASPETVVVNEILPAPDGFDWDGDGIAGYEDEWVELRNTDESSVGLGGWQIADGSGRSYTVPPGTTLPPGQYLVLYRRETGLALNNDGETVSLVRPDGTVADRCTYGDGPSYDVSLCRLPDGDGDWHGRCAPTPGGPNRALPVAGPADTTVFDARHMDVDSWVTIRGQITVPPGIFGERTAYLQDKTGGIKLYLPEDHGLWAQVGERWQVTGHTRMYYGELEIRVSERGDVRTLETRDPVPPLPIGTGVMVEPYEGTLVQLSGWAVEFERGGGFWIDDGTGWAQIYLDRDAAIARPWLEVGQPVQIVGIVSQYVQEGPLVGGYRLMPRYPFDLVVQGAPTAALPSLLPETGRR